MVASIISLPIVIITSRGHTAQYWFSTSNRGVLTGAEKSCGSGRRTVMSWDRRTFTIPSDQVVRSQVASPVPVGTKAGHSCCVVSASCWRRFSTDAWPTTNLPLPGRPSG